jgi:hypothetical protein
VSKARAKTMPVKILARLDSTVYQEGRRKIVEQRAKV